MKKIILLIIFSIFTYSIHTQELLNCNVISDSLYGIQYFVANDSYVFFAACANIDYDCEIYSTTGTSASITKIDIIPGFNSSYPNDLVNFQGDIFFSARNSTTQRVIYKATSTNTIVTVDNPDQLSNDFSVVNNRFYFASQDETGIPRARVKLNKEPGYSIFAPFSSPQQRFYQCKDNIIFNAENGLDPHVHISAGLPGSLSFIQTNFTSGLQFTSFNDRVYFVSSISGFGSELCYTDCNLNSTASKLVDIKPGAAGSFPTSLNVFNNFLYFAAVNESRTNVFKIDLSDNVTRVTNFPQVYNLYAFGPRLYFSVLNYSTASYDLYNLDFNDTIRVVRYSFTTSPHFVTFGNTLYFTCKDVTYGEEVFGIEKTNPDTIFLAADLNLGVNSSEPTNFFVNQNYIYFEAKYPPNSFYSCSKISNTPPPTFLPSTLSPVTTLPTTNSPTQSPVPTTRSTFTPFSTTGEITVNTGQKKKKVEWPTWSIVMCGVAGGFIILAIVALIVLNAKF